MGIKKFNNRPEYDKKEIDNYKKKFVKHLAQTVPGEKELIVVEAKDCAIKTAEGLPCLDMISGIAVANVGHSHPKVVDAVKTQMEKFAHVNVYGRFTLIPQVEIAERLASVSPGDLDVAFLTSTGTEANEGALKLARKYTGRPGFVAFERSFHGRTFGSLSVSWRKEWREPFEPLLEKVSFVPFNDLKAADQAIGKDTAAVIIEPVQGEGGVRIPSDNFLPGLRKVCDERGVLMICDEVQGAMGRAGQWFSCQNWDIIPDIITLAKSFGGGLPLGAILSTENIFSTFLDPPLSHLTTFGGNPVSCAAAIAAFDIIMEDDLINKSKELGSYLNERLHSAKSEFPDIITEIRGIGLWYAFDVNPKKITMPLVNEMQSRGVIVGSMLNSEGTIRIAPPLTIRPAEIDAFIGVLKASLRIIKRKD
jgi:acetylornithine/succinyldiaminopimelate/putrescine aminotransferase|tara:strand:- start:4040 stop:5302 length:1263 start_codon:yes stop_codon:yes gene_type:complete